MIEKFDEGSVEKKKVQGIEFSSDGGLVIYREIFKDDSSGKWESTSIETNDLRRLKDLREELKERYGEDVKI
jgi:hypothetical protein